MIDPEGYVVASAELSKVGSAIEGVTLYLRQPDMDAAGEPLSLHIERDTGLPPPSSSAQSRIRFAGVEGRWTPNRSQLEWLDRGAYHSLSIVASDRPGLPPRSSCATGVLLAFPGLPRDRPPLPAIVVTCRPFGVASVVARACHAPIEVKYGSEVVAQGEDDLPGQDHDRGRPHLGEALHERGEPDESAPNAAQPAWPPCPRATRPRWLAPGFPQLVGT